MQAIKLSSKAVMDEFHDGLAHYDYTRILSCWDFPAEIRMPDRNITLDTPRDMRCALRAVHEFYAAQGIAKVAAQVELLHETSDEEAICATAFRTIAATGLTTAKWTTSFLLRKSQRGWRITKANVSAQMRAFQFAEADTDAAEPVA